MTVAIEREQAAPPEEDALKKVWTDPGGLLGWFSTVQNGPIVYRFMTTVFVYFLLGGGEALLMRTQLARPENQFLTPDLYNELVTMHGSTMMFLFAVPMLEAFAEFLLPVMTGARELPFPRLTAFLYWVLLFGGALFNLSFVVGQLPDSGWSAYLPLSNIGFDPGLGIDFWLLGLDVAQIAALGDVFELGVGILRMRAPGMSLARMPIYLWSILVMAFMMLFAFTALFTVTLMLQLDRHWGTHFFDPTMGGDPLLWQHLFWIFGHPDVYIIFLPSMGMVAMILPTFARRPIVGHRLVIMAMLATAFLSFGVWVHHMFAAGLPILGMSFFSAASLLIAIPAGIQVMAFIATLWTGRLNFKTPLLFILGFLFTFVFGGLSGVTLALVPFDWQVEDTFYVVAHFHYVLIGGFLFPTFAALYYWLPKLTNHMLSERLGALNFWLLLIGFNLTFFPQHIAGFLGMPRRVYAYPAGIGLELPNLVSTIGAYLLGLAVLVFMWNVVLNIYLRRGAEAASNPWEAGSLDWATESPPPDEGYRVIPIVHSRMPLWDQARLDEGEPSWVRLVHALEEYPTKWRATLVTSLVEGVPEGIVRLAQPSILPVVAALGIMVVFAAEIYNLHPLAIAATLLTIGTIVIWMWPPRIERTFCLDDAGRPTIHGLPVYLGGPRAPGWWGMLFSLLVMAVGSGCLVFSYFYLQVHAQASWPPMDTPRPGWLLPLLNLLVVGGAAASSWWALRSVRKERRTGLLLGTSAAVGLGLVFLVLQAIEFTTWGWTPDTNAYTSAVGTLAGVHFGYVVLGVLLAGIVCLQSWLGYFNSWRLLAVENVTNYWVFVTIHWLVLLLVVYAPWS